MADIKAKKRVNLTIDEVVWKKAGVLHLNRSGICEEALRNAVGLGNDEDQMLRKQNELKTELNHITKQLQQKEEIKAFETETDKEEEDTFNFIMQSAERMDFVNDNVGIDRLEDVCTRKDFPIKPILEECKKRGYDNEYLLDRTGCEVKNG